MLKFTSARSLASLSAFCLAALLSAGCKQTKDSINNDQAIRQPAIDKARTSCSTTAKAKIGSTTPEMNAKIDSYCDCFATKGMASFSNTELMQIGLAGNNKFTPEQTAKLETAVNMCIGQMQMGPSPAPSAAPAPPAPAKK